MSLPAHQIDIEQGKAALKKTRSEAVKLQLKVTPEESEVTRSLKGDARKALVRLHKERGAAFDRDSIDTEVAYHEAVIAAVKQVLIPGAPNEQVKTALVNTVPTLEGHLAHAKNLQAQPPAKASP